MLGGAYVCRMVGNLRFKIGLAYSWKEINHFFFVLLFIGGQIPSTSPPEGLYSEGRFNGGFFCVTILGDSCLEGLILGGAYTVCRRGPQGQAGNLLE